MAENTHEAPIHISSTTLAKIDKNFEEAEAQTANDGKAAAVVNTSWCRRDEEFFRAGACHVLAHVFLEGTQGAGFRAYLIRPLSGMSGLHVFVSSEDAAFDYQGYHRSHDELVLAYVAKQKAKDSNYECEVELVPPGGITGEFCEKWELHRFEDYPEDVCQRAREFLKILQGGGAAPAYPGDGLAP